MATMETIRRFAGARMGLGDVSQSVVPKFGMLSEPRHGGTIASRYFTPTQCHPTHAVSGAICVASASVMPGTVAASLASVPEVPSGHDDAPIAVHIEHPSGTFDVSLLAGQEADALRIHAGGVTRTARKIMAWQRLCAGGGVASRPLRPYRRRLSPSRARVPRGPGR